jgi:hypothetical protein
VQVVAGAVDMIFVLVHSSPLLKSTSSSSRQGRIVSTGGREGRPWLQLFRMPIPAQRAHVGVSSSSLFLPPKFSKHKIVFRQGKRYVQDRRESVVVVMLIEVTN